MQAKMIRFTSFYRSSKGSALAEVRFSTDIEDPDEIFSFLREAYIHHQQEGEDFFEYSHALYQILRSVFKQSPDAVKMVIRDQFVEGVKDSALRRELCEMVREKVQSTLFKVCQEFISRSLEAS